MSGPSTCPVRRLELDHPDVVRLLGDAAFVKLGILRVPGGIDAQPARWWQGVRVVMAEQVAVDIEEFEERNP